MPYTIRNGQVDKKSTIQFEISLTVKMYCQKMTSVREKYQNENNQLDCPFDRVYFLYQLIKNYKM